MDWLQLSVYCAVDGVEQVSAMLSALGAEEQEIVEDMTDILAYLQENQQYWDYLDEEALASQRREGACVRVYVSAEAGGLEKKRAIEEQLVRLKEMSPGELGFDASSLHMGEKTVREEDWANVWRGFYHSMEVGDRLLVVPDWEEVEAPQGRVLLRMEPGLVFGTGEHQTTQLCLELLEDRLHSGGRVLDLGCGSGILSVAALLLGADAAVGVDIDPNARGVALENARKNGVNAGRFQVLIGDALGSEIMDNTLAAMGPYQVLLSNIVADVVAALAAQAKAYLVEGGLWISSGIITERLEDVLTAMEGQGWIVLQTKQKDDWWAILAKKGAE